jgi:hypothetical protein
MPPVGSFQRVTHKLASKAKLFASYCPACGQLIAASPRQALVQLVETIHDCPQSIAFRCRTTPATQL